MRTTATNDTTRMLRLYVGAVIAAGALVATALVAAGWDAAITGPDPVAFWILAIFLIVGELHPLNWLRRRGVGAVTVSWTFAFAILLIASPLAAVITLGLASIGGDVVARKPTSRALFNSAQVMISLAGGAAVLELLGQRTALLGNSGPSPAWLLALVLAAATIFLLNGALTCLVIALHQDVPFWATWREGTLSNMSVDGMLLALSPVFVVVARFSLLLLPLVLLTVWAVYRSAHLALAQQHEATYDQLTGLPNRRLFTEQVEAAIQEAQHRGGRVAVMILDLNGFKEVNDRLGHHMGDLVLQEIGARFSEAARSVDVVARLGGDEFAVVAREINDRWEAEAIARRLLNALRRPCVAEGVPVSMSASLGIALYPAHGADFGTLLGNADVAMYASKQSDRDITTYDNERDRGSQGQLALLAELVPAMRRHELVLEYQPKLDLRSRQLVGVEALIRWRHPQLGLLPPREFIPLAAHTDLIEPLTEYVLLTALTQCAGWQELGFEIPVSVNVSDRNFHDADFPNQVARALAATSMPGSMLEIELVENTVMEDPERTASVATALRAMGVRLAIDDYGTGYSSLATLRDLPINALKIDQSFVTAMATDCGNGSIVRATIELAHSLGLETVAVGVEQAAVWDLLREFGCTSAQGFLIGRPGDANAIVDFLLLASPTSVNLTDREGVAG